MKTAHLDTEDAQCLLLTLTHYYSIQLRNRTIHVPIDDHRYDRFVPVGNRNIPLLEYFELELFTS